ELVDSAARRRATERLAEGEPVLLALAVAAGVRDESAEPDFDDDAVTTVLAAVGDSVMELEAVRQRKQIEDAAFDNVWRGYKTLTRPRAAISCPPWLNSDPSPGHLPRYTPNGSCCASPRPGTVRRSSTCSPRRRWARTSAAPVGATSSSSPSPRCPG